METTIKVNLDASAKKNIGKGQGVIYRDSEGHKC